MAQYPCPGYEVKETKVPTSAGRTPDATPSAARREAQKERSDAEARVRQHDAQAKAMVQKYRDELQQRKAVEQGPVVRVMGNGITREDELRIRHEGGELAVRKANAAATAALNGTLIEQEASVQSPSTLNLTGPKTSAAAARESRKQAEANAAAAQPAAAPAQANINSQPQVWLNGRPTMPAAGGGFIDPQNGKIYNDAGGFYMDCRLADLSRSLERKRGRRDRMQPKRELPISVSRASDNR